MSARTTQGSQISQALFQDAAGRAHSADSADTAPVERVHPEVVEVMRELGIDLSHRHPKLLTHQLAGVEPEQHVTAVSR